MFYLSLMDVGSHIYRLGPISEEGFIEATEISTEIGWEVYGDESFDQLLNSNCLYTMNQGGYRTIGQYFERPLNFESTRIWVADNFPVEHKEKLFRVFDLMEKDHAVFFLFSFPEEDWTLYDKKGAQHKIVYWFSKRNNAFIAQIPELPDCLVNGQTEDEAIANARIAIDQWIQAAKESGREIPVPKLYL
jgi:predicted RNase H-like HicB family nuclease